MTGEKSAFLFAALCALFTSSVLISDVSARSIRSTQYSSYGTNGVSVGHGYPSSKPGSLSGASSSSGHSYPSTNIVSSSGSKLNSAPYPSTNFGTSSRSAGHAYPTSKPGSLSGASSSSGHSYPSTNIVSSSSNKLNSAPYPSANFGSNSGSSGHAYPTKPGSLSGSSSSPGHSYPSNKIVSSSGSNLASAPYPSVNFGTNSVSSGHAYPMSNPGSLSGGGSSFGQNNQINKFGSSQFPSMNFGTNSGSAGHAYPTPRPGSLSGGGNTFGQNNAGITIHTGSGSHYPTGGSNYQHNSYTSNSYHNNHWGSNSHNSGQNVMHHYHYVYKPPTVIQYGSQGINYPIYIGQPPTYVYEYRASRNKYRHLLAGLALYNLGRMSATTNSYHYHENYIPQPDEYCTFIVQYRRFNSEEMAIDCRAITCFIYEDQPQIQNHMTTNIFNQTIVTSQMILPNGALVEHATVTQNPNNYINGIYIPDMKTQIDSAIGRTQHDWGSSGQIMPNMQQINTMSTTQLSSVTDPRFSGSPVEVIPDMECFVTRHVRFSTHMKKSVPCDLLHKYSVSSLRNSGAVLKSTLMVLLAGIIFVIY